MSQSRPSLDTRDQRYILHVDGDSFFASCETSIRPYLRGKPVVVGKERSIATALSYEAKALGFGRGMLTGQIKRACPEAIILSSDYLLYKVFSGRMFNILKRYTDTVEHYSIDECFADITDVVVGMADGEIALDDDISSDGAVGADDKRFENTADTVDGLRDIAAEKIGRSIKAAIETELGMTVSIGIGPTKVLAKIGSKKNKPSGFTYVPKGQIADFIDNMQVGKVWGIGPGTSLLLNKKGIKLVSEFVAKDRRWVEVECDKHLRELWYEINGVSVMEVHSHESADLVSNGFGNAGQSHATADEDQKSIQRTRTFYPTTTRRSALMIELSQNVEEACARLRKSGLAASWFSFFLKTQEFRYKRVEVRLERPTVLPQEILKMIEARLDEIYDWRNQRTVYRATGITLGGLKLEGVVQERLFGDPQADDRRDSLRHIADTLDALDRRFGEGIIRLASSMDAVQPSGLRAGRGTDKGVANKKSPGAVISRNPKKLYLPEILIS